MLIMFPFEQRVLIVLGVVQSIATAATAPYTDNFDAYPAGNTTPANFTEFTDGDWSVSNDGANGVYSSVIVADGTTKTSAASIGLTNVPGQNFTVSTSVKVDFYDAPTAGRQNSVAVVALGSDPSLDAGTNYKLVYLLHDTLSGGELDLVKSSGSTDSYLSYPSWGSRPSQGDTYTFTLHGSYIDGTLYLVGTVSNGQRTVTIRGSDANPLTGSYFGYWDLAAAVAPFEATFTSAAFDDFAVRFESFPPRLANLSARMNVGTGDSVGIGGFIVSGNAEKLLLLRAIGPSLSLYTELSPILEDPVLELHASNGALLATNDNWKDTQQDAIQATGMQPPDDRESALLVTLDPGSYTAILRGKGETTGIGLVEAYDLPSSGDSRLANLSARGMVGTGDNVMIGGLIARGDALAHVLLRALGPSLQSSGIPNSLSDPTLELHDQYGTLIGTNDNWRESQESEIQSSGLAPTSDEESAMIVNLLPESYTAIVHGNNNTTGIALFESYQLK
jgi:hypothetical protein